MGVNAVHQRPCACGQAAMPGRAACSACIAALGQVDYAPRPRPVAPTVTTSAPTLEASEAWNWLAWVAVVVAILGGLLASGTPGLLIVPLVVTAAAYVQHRRRLLDAVGVLWVAVAITVLAVIVMVARALDRLA